MVEKFSEKDLVLSLKASLAIQAQDDVLELFVAIAQAYISRGLTQEGADILAFILNRDNVPEDVVDLAVEAWEDLERWICPRVLYDAEIFGKKAYFEDVVEYILIGV